MMHCLRFEIGRKRKKEHVKVLIKQMEIKHAIEVVETG